MRIALISDIHTVTLRRVAIDARARRAAVEACDNPLREALLASYAAR